MALADVYQLIVKSHLGSVNLENVFFYNRTVGAGNAGVLTAQFLTDVIPAITPLQSVSVIYDQITTFSLGDLSDFTNLVLANTGEVSGDSLPTSDALSYSLKLDTRAIRPGGKRISGIPESVQNDGQVTDATYITAINFFRDVLNNSLFPAGSTFVPVVVKRIKTLIAGTTPPQYTYRLPGIGDPLVLGTVVQALSSTVLGSQVSRKRKKV